MKRLSLILLLLAVTASRSVAQWAVFDVGNTMQTIQVVKQVSQQVSTLGKIAGINTEQLQTFNSVLSAIGKANDLANNPNRATPNRILNVMRQLPGMEDSGLDDLSKLFNSTGVLDVFMNQPVTEWNNMVRDPMHYFGDRLRNQAITRIGQEVGMTNAETQYVKWIAQMSDAQREDNALKITMAASDLLLNRWFKSVEQRRKTQQTFAAQVEVNKQDAASAGDVNARLAAGSAQMTTTNQILLSTMQQQQEAAAVQAMGQSNENNLLDQQLKREEMRRAVERATF